MIKKGFLLLLFLSQALFIPAQEYQRYIVNKLSAPEMDGRGYVNDGAEKAADFIASQFDSLGLSPLDKSYFQQFSFLVNRFPGEMMLSISGDTLLPGIDYLVDPISGGGSGSDYSIKKISIYSPKQLNKLLKDINKISNTVLLIEVPDTLSQNGRNMFMQTVFLLSEQWPVILQSDEKLTWSVGGTTLANPLFWVKNKKISAKDRIAFSVDSRLKKVSQKNVIALKRSASPDARYLVISAHYDHLGRMGAATYFPGANDNASGVAELLALAASLDTIPLKHHILFIAFAGEEAGLLGSNHFVEQPLIPLAEIDFVLNLDINGTGSEGITVVNATQFEEAFAYLLEANEEVNAVVDIKKRGAAANSDHYPFYNKGVPAFFIYTRGGSKAYHDVYDTPETLSFEKAVELVQLYRTFLLKLDQD